MVEISGDEKNSRPILGISIGDPAGIGPEICLKALSKIDIFKKAIPIVYADKVVLEDALKITGKDFVLRQIKEPCQALGNCGAIEFIEAGGIKEPKDYSLGEISKKAGEAAFQYVLKALNDALAGSIQAVVTCPISKEAINLAGHQFAGHTEIFAHYTNT
jgi:4-hydroxythreonine-4-phosphate dehydrogenase